MTTGNEREDELERRLRRLEEARDVAEHEWQAATVTAAERELDLQRRLIEQETLRAGAERRLETANAEIERRAADVRAITEVLAQREETFRGALAVQQEAARAVVRLEGKLARVQARYANAQADIGRFGSLQDQLQEVRGEYDSARRRVSERDAIISRLSDAIDHARGERESIGSRLEAAEAEAAEADALSETLQSEVERISSELDELRTAGELRLTESETALAAALLRAEEAERQSSVFLAERDVQVARASELSRELDKVRELAERAATVEEEVVELRDALSRAQNELRTQDVGAAEQRRRVEALEADIRDEREHATELQTKLDSESASRRDLERLHEESLDRERMLRDRFVLERDSLEERLEATLAALNDARRPQANESALEAMGTERNRLNAQLLRERAARKGLEEHVMALRQEIEQRTQAVGSNAEVRTTTASASLHVDAESPVGASDPEATARAEFADRYLQVCRRSGLDHLSEADRALPWPVFQEVAGDWQPRTSIIVCVRNALDDVRRCLESVARHLTANVEVLIVDDGSDEATARFLEAVAQRGSQVRLILNPDPPHGYTVAANLGLRAALGDYIVLLNSDTIVTAGWLERIIECADSDPDIGIVGPVSNAASHQSVPKVREDGIWATNPLPEWLTAEGMAVAVAGASDRGRPRVPFVNGYCYAITRRALEAVGLLDEENFSAGYCEENDFSMRARQASFTSAIADDAFVFHAKSRSYTPEGRNENAKRNYVRFLEKHGVETVQPLVDSLESTPPVAELGRRLERVLLDEAQLVKVVHERLGFPVHPLFVLPGISEGGSGGSHSIVQEAAGMQRLGVPARIAVPATAMGRVRDAYPEDVALFTTYERDRALHEAVGDANVVIATHSDSVALVAEVLEQRPSLVSAYYIQDYEPFFWPEGSEHTRRALASYTALKGARLFAKTHWICNVVSAAHRIPVHKVEPSIDRAIYRPPDARAAEAPPVVAAMVRPRTPRRQPRATVQLLERLTRTYGANVEIVTFGCSQADFNQLTEMPLLRQRHRGLLSRDGVAEILRGADVFVDHSVYQAFGRTALEAMACACVPVVPVAGGSWEFAEPGINSMVCDTSDEAAVYSAVARLVDDIRLRSQLREAGLTTARRYSVERAAMSEFALFASALLLRASAGNAEGLATRVS